MRPYLKINSCYYFLCFSGLKSKIFRSHYKNISQIILPPDIEPGSHAGTASNTICALGNSRICGKSNKYICHFTGKQQILQIRFMRPQLLACPQHIKLYGPSVAKQIMWSGQICSFHLSSETVNPWKGSGTHSEATAGTQWERKL